MPLTLHIYVPLHYYFGLDIDPTLLYIQIQKRTICNRYSTYYDQICATNKYMIQMSHMQINSCADMRQLSYELTSISSVTRSTAIHVFNIIGTCPWTTMSATSHVYPIAFIL